MHVLDNSNGLSTVLLFDAELSMLKTYRPSRMFAIFFQIDFYRLLIFLFDYIYFLQQALLTGDLHFYMDWL